MLSTNTSNTSLKSLVGLLENTYDDELYYKSLCTSILSVLSFSLSAKLRREVFVFSDRVDSGIVLFPIKDLSKFGYCFCGGIRIEHIEDENKIMTIFKLSTGKEWEMELFLKGRILNYTVVVF